jgi:DNA-binding transcriptional ArsR family regulator
MDFRKPLTESDILERFSRGQITLPPLRLKIVETESAGWDAIVVASWSGQQAKFAVECKALSTPKGFDDAVRRCQTESLPPGVLPMLVMPFLRESQLQELEMKGISGVDLCGNGVVVAPGRFTVFRSGAKNQFPTYSPIKNIYRKNTSMVARVFLATPFFESVQQVREAVNARDLLLSRWKKTPMGLSTVSKALKVLEEDLIVDRSKGLRLVQPEKSLAALEDSYMRPSKEPRIRLKIQCDKTSLVQLLRAKADAVSLPIVATGLSSVSRYAVMQREDVLSIYCPDITALRDSLSGNETDRFPNVELIETDEQPLYFDAREAEGFLWASPVQTYLELMTGDKRDQETAEQVKTYLLRSLGVQSQ